MDYDFGNKRQYRRDFYAFVDRELRDVPRRQRRIVYLETSAALESEFLIRSGYHPENLIACNVNPAEIAHATRALDGRGLPRVVTHGRDVRDVLRDWNGEAPHVVNLDLTSCLSGRTFMLLRELTLPRRPLIVGVTLLRGRERGGLRYLLTRFEQKLVDSDEDGVDMPRLSAVLAALAFRQEDDTVEGRCRHVLALRSGRYRSTAGSQTMLWLACALAPHDSSLQALATPCACRLPLEWARSPHAVVVAQIGWALGLIRKTPLSSDRIRGA